MQSEHQRGRLGIAWMALRNIWDTSGALIGTTLGTGPYRMWTYLRKRYNASSPSKELLEVADRDFAQTFDEEFRKIWEEQE